MKSRRLGLETVLRADFDCIGISGSHLSLGLERSWSCLEAKIEGLGENLGRSRLGLVSFSKEKFSFTSLAVSNMVCMPIMDK